MKGYIGAMITVFVLLGVFFYLLHQWMPAIAFLPLMVGNLILFVLSLIAYFIITKQLSNRPQAFIRGVSAASFIKLFACMIGIGAYALINRGHLHKPSLFMLLGIYAVYSAVETILLSNMARRTN